MDEIEGEFEEGEYKVGRGKPPLHSRFKKGHSGNPRGPRPKNLPALPRRHGKHGEIRERQRA
jgi:hypothetical protein